MRQPPSDHVNFRVAYRVAGHSRAKARGKRRTRVRAESEHHLMDIRKELQTRGFVAAGAIRPVDAGGCLCIVEPDVRGFIVYAHIVGNEVKKFGTTAPSLKARVSQNASTINQVLALKGGLAT